MKETVLPLMVVIVTFSNSFLPAYVGAMTISYPTDHPAAEITLIWLELTTAVWVNLVQVV